MKLLSSFAAGDRGVAIVAVTMVMVVVALLGGALVTQTTNSSQISNRVFSDKQALYNAESAKERGYQEVKNDIEFTTFGVPAFLTGVPIAGGGSYDLMAVTLQENPEKIVQIIALGTSSAGDRKSVNVVAEVIREDVSVWNNAIFGGSGQVGGVINGNAAIHGSVHLLGDNVGEGNNSIAALDMGGSSLIHNNYIGMPPELQALLPALPTTNFGGEDIATIDARLRVKNGAVGVSGSSEIGQADVVGNALKETMDGIYIEVSLSETRWTGTEVIDGVPNPDRVSSDNGTDVLYDLGDAIVMPGIGDPYEDPFGNSHASYGDYFSGQSLLLPAITLDDSNDAALEIQAYSMAGSFPEGTVVQVDVISGSFSVTDGINTIGYNPNLPGGGGLLVNGMITVEGDLVIGKKNFDITYAGKGTIYAANGAGGAGDIDVHSDLLPVGQFPTVSVLGLMATNNINLATGPGDSQLMMAGAFFAGVEIVSAKQNNIAGTFVSNTFNMGNNVPRIYEVPTLAENLPPGLIATEPIWVVTGFEERSWQAKKLEPADEYTTPWEEFYNNQMYLEGLNEEPYGEY